MLGFASILRARLVVLLGSVAQETETASGAASSSDQSAEVVHLDNEQPNDSPPESEIPGLSETPSGNPMGAEEEFDLEDCVRSCVDPIRDLCDVAGLRLDINLAQMLPQIPGDADHFKEVLLGLVANAMKFTGAGGTVTIATRILDDGSPQLRVSDTRRGIPAVGMQELCSTLERDGGVDPRPIGEEAGLHAAQEFMNDCGGQLSVNSVPDLGTTVTLAFPPERGLQGLREAS